MMAYRIAHMVSIYDTRLRLFKMRVVIISQYFPPDMGGGATRAYNAAKGLAESGFDVTVVSAFPHYPKGVIPKKYRKKPFLIEKNDSITLIRTFVPPLQSKGLGRRIILFLSFMFSSLLALPYINKTDVIWSANPNVTAMFPGIIFRFVHKCPLVQNVDDLWPEVLFDLGTSKRSFIGRLGKLLAGLSYRLADAITPISPGYVKVIRKRYGIESAKIEVIRAGVELNRFNDTKESNNQSDKFRVLYIGAFSPTYNFKQVFDAAELLSENQDIEIILQGDGEVAPELEKMRTETNASNIRVIRKIVSREEVVRVMNDASVLLLPLCGVGSIEMGISSKLYEYQAIGKPILCISNGQPGEYVSKSESGIVIVPGDSEAIAQSVIHLKNNPQIAARYGQNGREYVEEHLTTLKIGAEFVEFFRKLRS